MAYLPDALSTGSIDQNGLAINVRIASASGSTRPSAVATMGRHDNGNFIDIKADESGYSMVRIAEPITAYGEVSVGELTQIVGADFIYGFLSGSFSKLEVESSSQSFVSSGSLFCITAGNTSGSIVAVRSRRSIKHRSGLGSVGRFDAIFSTATVGTVLSAGVGDQENSFFFTQLGSDYGGGMYIGYRNGARRAIYSLTLTAASSTAQNVTITLGGSGTLVAVTNSSNAIKTANEIAAGDFAGNLGGWQAFTSGSTVNFVSSLARYWNEDFGITATTASGTFSVVQNGRSVSALLVAQQNWNVDSMDGSGPSGMTLNPAKINEYQIRFGAHNITFSIMHDEDSENTVVHKIRNLNSASHNTTENLSLPVFWSSSNYADVSGRTIYTSECSGFSQGTVTKIGPKRSFGNSKTGVGTTYTAIFSIRNPLTLRGLVNKSEVFLQTLAAACEATKPVDFMIVRGATIGGTPAWGPVGSESSMQYDIAGTTVTDGVIQLLFTLGKSSSTLVSLSDSVIFLAPGEILTVAAKASATTADINSSINWIEDI